MFTTNDYPAQWKSVSIIRFINKSNGKNVRLISLSFLICKQFEFLVKYRLEWIRFD